MNICVRLEGGLGDHLLGNRFVPAILDKYPSAKITAYSDTEGNTFQKEGVLCAYGHLYEDFKVIQNKKHKDFWVNCQFGEDNYYGALENVPGNVVNEMNSFDKFYDLHIDSLKWMQHDYDWLRYFYFFPRPSISEQYKESLFDEYIVLHLASETSVGHRLEQWYINRLVKELEDSLPCVIISTPKTNHFFEDCLSENVKLVNTSVSKAFDIITKAKLMISTDSGFRYLAYGAGVPTLTFSSSSDAPHQVMPSHQIRWLPSPPHTFPLNFDAVYVSQIAKRILGDKGYALLPYITDIDSQLVRRKYTINQEKTK